ncbi:MAG TPA: hypothetical protein VJ985_00915 [Gammaproteobacteria bacterium]|nr:hypothetical protein [Gammaproteobacteria bacterium]
MADQAHPPDPREFLRSAEPQRRLDYLVGRASMAPSPYNVQPWRFRSKDPARVDLQLDASRRLAEADPEGRLLYLSLGAALENFVIAAADLGFAPELEWFPDGEEAPTAVRIHLGEPGSLPEPDPRVDLQARRRTGHGPLSGPLEAHVRTAVSGLDLGEVELVWAADEDRAALAELAGRTASARWRRPAFRQELLDWLRNDAGELEERRDGFQLVSRENLPGWLAGGMRRALYHAPRLFDPGRRTAKRLERAPAVIALLTPEDGPGHWMAAGRAYQRVGLELAHAGISLGPEGLLTAYPETREEAKHILARGEPQLVARLGRGRPRPPTPRRRLHRVLNPPSPKFPLYPRSD